MRKPKPRSASNLETLPVYLCMLYSEPYWGTSSQAFGRGLLSTLLASRVANQKNYISFEFFHYFQQQLLLVFLRALETRFTLPAFDDYLELRVRERFVAKRSVVVLLPNQKLFQSCDF